MATAAPAELDRYLADCRGQVIDEIRREMPRDTRHTGGLYEMMLDYPLRPGKALRPSLSIAACRLAGGSLDAVLPTAAALELYHNAFLVHDDVEDLSELRRGAPTLHRMHGVAAAINVGDGMLALAMRPLVENAHHIGLAPALRVLEEVSAMARETAEGQAMELRWIHAGAFELPDHAYLRMVYKKSTRYSFVTPLTVGALCARAPDELIRRLQRFGALVGIAFQIQDDLLNLEGSEHRYGKEIQGDLYEGKRTIPLLHALRRASAHDRLAAMKVLRKGREQRTANDVQTLRVLMDSAGSIPYARDIARRHCTRACAVLDGIRRGRAPSVHLDFLGRIVDYVIAREQ